MEQIVIFRKGPMPKGKTEKQVNAIIEDLIREDKIRKVRRQTFHAILGTTFSKLPQVTQHDIDKSNGPRNLLRDGRGWVVPENEYGASGPTDSTVIAIKKQIEKALGISADLFSVCLIKERTAEEL